MWLVSVLAATGGGQPVPIDAALRQERGSRTLTAEWERLGRAFPSIARSTGSAARPAGVDPGPGLGPDDDDRSHAGRHRVRRPRADDVAPQGDADARGSSPSPRTRWSAPTSSATCRGPCCSTTSSSRRPTSPGSPSRPARSSGRATAGSRSIGSTSSRRPPRSPSATQDRQLTGAEILRHSLGLDGARLRVDVRGHSWATDILARAAEAAASPVTRPRGFAGELRSYQAEALAWIGFLERADLGGCLALDMGLGKTPTVLAHLARAHGVRTGARDRAGGGRRQLGGRGGALRPRACASSSTTGRRERRPTQLAAEIAAADVVITTYATAVRDIDALGGDAAGPRCVLDEAQAIKNPASETAQQLRRIPARMRLALTGTPIENGLGDLWAILDFTNPGLVGTPAGVHRPAGRRRRERAAGAERAPRVPAHQAASRRSPPSSRTRSTSSTTAR